MSVPPPPINLAVPPPTGFPVALAFNSVVMHPLQQNSNPAQISTVLPKNNISVFPPNISSIPPPCNFPKHHSSEFTLPPPPINTSVPPPGNFSSHSPGNYSIPPPSFPSKPTYNIPTITPSTNFGTFPQQVNQTALLPPTNFSKPPPSTSLKGLFSIYCSCSMKFL